MLHPTWLLVLRPDGEIVEVAAGAPREWIGRPVRDCPVDPRVKTAVAAMVERPASEVWCERAMVKLADVDVEIIMLEAVPLRRVPTSIFELLARTSDALLAQARATEVSLKLVVTALPDTLLIDAEKIAWGVATLVGNALRHLAGAEMDGEKTVRVEAKMVHDGSAVVLSVIDNGPGIPEDRLRTLLRRDPATQRAGGLALVVLNDVMVAHGGRLEIESSTEPRNHGTTVRLFLPVESRLQSLENV